MDNAGIDSHCLKLQSLLKTVTYDRLYGNDYIFSKINLGIAKLLISASGETTYTIKGSDDEFTTSDVELVNQEESYQSGRKLKDETITIVGTFKADSKHGTFVWTATTTMDVIIDIDDYPEVEVEYVLIQAPEPVDEIIEEPIFEVE